MIDYRQKRQTPQISICYQEVNPSFQRFDFLQFNRPGRFEVNEDILVLMKNGDFCRNDGTFDSNSIPRHGAMT